LLFIQLEPESIPRGYSVAGKAKYPYKNTCESMWNRTRNLSVCSLAPQSTIIIVISDHYLTDNIMESLQIYGRLMSHP
jgi:hypothetical protein